MSQLFTRSEALDLLQTSPKASGNGLAKPGKCHNCGQADHWQCDCPKPPKLNSTPNGGSNNGGGSGNGKCYTTMVAMLVEVTKAGVLLHLVLASHPLS